MVEIIAHYGAVTVPIENFEYILFLDTSIAPTGHIAKARIVNRDTYVYELHGLRSDIYIFIPCPWHAYNVGLGCWDD